MVNTEFNLEKQGMRNLGYMYLKNNEAFANNSCKMIADNCSNTKSKNKD